MVAPSGEPLFLGPITFAVTSVKLARRLPNKHCEPRSTHLVSTSSRVALRLQEAIGRSATGILSQKHARRQKRRYILSFAERYNYSKLGISSFLFPLT